MSTDTGTLLKKRNVSNRIFNWTLFFYLIRKKYFYDFGTKKKKIIARYILDTKSKTVEIVEKKSSVCIHHVDLITYIYHDRIYPLVIHCTSENSVHRFFSLSVVKWSIHAIVNYLHVINTLIKKCIKQIMYAFRQQLILI